jgi:chaperonin GroES
MQRQHRQGLSAVSPTPSTKFATGSPDGLFALRRITMRFRPLGDRVVVRRVKDEQKSAGGIIIPETAQEKAQEGVIVAVGPGALNDLGKRIPPEVKEGDFVLFGKWSGTEVKIDGDELLIMKESDISGVVEGRKTLKKAA